MRLPSSRRAVALTASAALLPVLPLLGSGSAASAAAPAPTATPRFGVSVPGVQVPVRASGLDTNALIPRLPAAAAASSALRSRDGVSAKARPSTWTVNYTAGTVATDAQKAALARAVQTWSQVIDSPTPITMQVTINAQPEGVLGSAGPEALLADDSGGGGVVANTFYPVALANALSGEDLNGSDPEIVAEFSNESDTFSFSSAPVAGKYDFETVVLHEIAHGLGFIGSMEVYNKPGRGLVGGWDVGGEAPRLPFIFDRRAIRSSAPAVTLFSLGQDSTSLASALTTGRVAWNGPNVRNLRPCSPLLPELYTPGSGGRGYVAGTSYSHLDEDAFPPGQANSLMTPFIDEREVILAPGSLLLAMLRDIGWTTAVQPISNAFTSCAPAAANVATNQVVTGNAPAGTVVTVFFRKRGETQFVPRRQATANAENRWAATYGAVDDWDIIAVANGITPAPTVKAQVRPTVGARPLVRLKRGTTLTLTGRGIAGTVVQLRQTQGGTTFTRNVRAGSTGVWSYRTTFTADRTILPIGVNGRAASVVTVVDTV